MKELFGAAVWVAICGLSVLLWWPLLMVILHYWIGRF